jgi:hypothetical protein
MPSAGAEKPLNDAVAKAVLLTWRANEQNPSFLVLIMHFTETFKGHYETLQSRDTKRHIDKIDTVLVPKLSEMDGCWPKQLRIKIIE